jgi:putative colanic acid biosynthesis glycosyltransferase
VPVLTIVTVHLNDFDGLFRTFRSLESKFPKDNLEWIVIDGGSETISIDQHNSLELVKAFASYYISEPDDGIYDAMNKGTRSASGKYLLYLNAGDELHPGFIWDILQEIILSNDADMIWGRYDVRDRNDTVYSRKTRHPAWLRYGTAVCHQAVFFRRSVLGSSPYNTDLSIAADYDLICRIYTAGEKIRMLDVPICIFELVGESGLDKRQTLREEAKVRRKYFPIVGIFNLLITNFKLLMWNLGTLVPSFRRKWARYF